MIEGHMYEQGAKDGWWPCPYGCANGGNVGLSEETILRNALGLKNVINSLLELRSSGGPTRPDEANTANNRRRKTYSSIWTFNQFLDYHRVTLPAILQARRTAIDFQVANTGRIVFRGSRPIPAFPAPHPGESPPPVDAPAAPLILDNPPCAYKLTAEQFNGARTDGPEGMRTTVAQRLDAHGWKVVTVADGFVVPMAQPERGLIPLLLDAQAVEELVGAERLFPVPRPGNGPLVVSSGVTCLAGGSVQGPVTVKPGATLIATGTSFRGPILATGAAGVFLTNSTVDGPVLISGTTSAAVIADTTIRGLVGLSDNRTTGGALLVAGNTVTGLLQCGGNTPDPVNIEILNSVRGLKTGQCARL
jgi:hypothetical protein